MKTNTILIAIAIMLTILIAPTALAQSPKLSVDVLKQDPKPAQPGQYVTITLQLNNEGNEEAPDAAIQAMDQFPFTVVNDEVEMIGNLKSQRSYVYEAKVKVSSEAVVGENELKIRYTPDQASGEWYESTKTIAIRNNQASLNVNDVSLEPEEFLPGKQAKIAISVENTADIALRDISVQLNLIRSEQEQTTELPFTPTGTSEEQLLGKLQPGESTSATYTIHTDSAATPGFYKIPVTMTYYDEQGTEHTKTNIIGVPVKAEPELDVFLESSEVNKEQRQGTLTVKFVNKGIHDLKFLDVTFQDGDGYEVLSNRKEYIGDLDSDDYRTQEFRVSVNDPNATLTVNTKYGDERNNKYNDSFSMPMRYSSQAQGNGSSVSPSFVILVVLAVVLVGRWMYRKRKSKNAKR